MSHNEMIAAFFTQLSMEAIIAADKEVKDLTDNEKVALAWAAGCEVEPKWDKEMPYSFRFATKNPVGFSRLEPGGPITVFERKD